MAARPRRLDCRIERQQAGLTSNALDAADNRTDGID
jgi:hypothetical protein